MLPPATPSHGITPPTDTTASTVPSAQPALANVIADMTGEREASAAFSSPAMPVDLHIDIKLRAKIHGNGYVDFGGLLSRRNETTEQYQLQVTGDSVALVPRSRPTQITSIEQWTEAFHVYVAVYCQAHPLQTAVLMKYAAIVQGIAKRSGMTAALFYDDNFRTWQQHQPVVQWGVINSELFLQSSSEMGIPVHASRRPFLAPLAAPQGGAGRSFGQVSVSEGSSADTATGVLGLEAPITTWHASLRGSSLPDLPQPHSKRQICRAHTKKK